MAQHGDFAVDQSAGYCLLIAGQVLKGMVAASLAALLKASPE
jgi:hypothetical protein